MPRHPYPPGGVHIHPLSYVRAQRGWTYQDVVDVIARRIGNSAARREKAWRWEHWAVMPDRESQCALAEELGVPKEHLDLYPWPQWLPDGDPIRAAFGWSQRGGLAALSEALEYALLDRRGFMKLLGPPLAGLADCWQRLEPAELLAVLGGGRVTDQFVTDLEAGLPRLRQLEATRGGLSARRLIDAELGVATDVLARASYSAATAKRLYVLAGELGRMAGWASFDAGLHAAAQRYWVAALHAAHAAGDRALGANILKSMSLQCHDFARPHEALALARGASEGAGRAASRVRAMLAHREARAHAALGDAKATERLMAQADNALASARGDEEEPAWAAYFDDAEYHAQIGTCYLDLGRADTAQRYFHHVLDSLSATKVRDRATYLTRGAAAQLALGSLDQACASLTAAVPLMRQAPSQRNVERVFTVRNRMQSHHDDRHVRDLDEQLAVLVA
jgi:tetratricopeptide (TPR) repeat protein